ncbi:MAG: metal-sensitive transcriptional regulator [Patescibacteria group bacterium]|jgi:DNA-binding FrmR family transcriptional regulator
MIEPYISQVKTNLKKASGQLAAIEAMVDDNRYCVDVAQQINAAIGLLKQANSYILEGHLLSCGAEKLNSKKPDERLDFVKELTKAFKLNNK